MFENISDVGFWGCLVVPASTKHKVIVIYMGLVVKDGASGQALLLTWGFLKPIIFLYCYCTTLHSQKVSYINRIIIRD